MPALAASQTWVLRLRFTTATGMASACPSFYPNPTAGGAARLALVAAPAAQSQVQVFDLTGRLLQIGSFGGSYALETAGWVVGNCFVRVQSGTAVAMQQLVVER